ncbi:MAG: neutral/alkaline non-lysosomal ceramidase N-terminal domain-containing protein [Thermoguttaceae bacterium]|nr:neutral/alkaline non-lysosomal ceramidase N-terminal domain-containing protein [Thermoguttaceae bacterium]
MRMSSGYAAVLLALGLACLSHAAETPPWKVGVAAVKITPQSPLPMAGYAARKGLSEGVAQDLFAKAMVIEDSGGGRVAFLTLDLIGIPRELRDWLGSQVHEKVGIDSASLLVNASHTHCGPEVRLARVAADERPAEVVQAVEQYADQLRANLVTVVTQAAERLAPARLDFVRGRAGFAMNRRRPTDKGYVNAPHYDGPVDHEVPVLRVSDAEGKLVALLFGYACHNTTLGDYLYRGDYAGYAQQYLEELHPGATAMFMAGCGADQNPYPRHQLQHVEWHGRALASAVEAALETVPRPLEGPLSVAMEEVAIDFAPLPSRQELEKTASGKGVEATHAKRLLKELDEKGAIRSTYAYPIQVVRFGNSLTLVALAGEAVVDYALRLKRELPGEAVWVAAYSNDVFGYIPSLRVLNEGGYEAGGAMVYGSLPGAFAPSIEERIVGQVLEMARRPAGAAADAAGGGKDE